MPVAFRLPLLAAGIISLAFGIAAGLARLGFAIELPSPPLVGLHGPLIGGAFFGAVISLERAVALGYSWAYLAPLAAGAAGIVWILGASAPVGGALLVAGGIVMLAASVLVWKRQPELHNVILGTGAACWMLGGAVVAAGEASAATPGWIGFLVLTIAGERLELSRFMQTSPAAKRAFAAICAVLLLAIPLAIWLPQAGWILLAASLLALSIWLALKDIARRTIRESGLTRYIAAALLAGYFWLAIGALIALSDSAFAPGRPAYDAALHAWFLGFVFSMVFGHAPIIAPALLRVTLPYSAWFYLPLAVLHLSLAERIAGDLLQQHAMRERGAAANAVALALFIVTIVIAAVSRRRP